VFGMVFTVLPVVAVVAQGPPFNASVVMFIVVCLAQAGVLAALDIRGFLGSGRSAPSTAA
jgi:hypothetical protein